MSHTITMERPFSRKARPKMNTDLTVEITDLAWTITNAALAGDYLHDDDVTEAVPAIARNAILVCRPINPVRWLPELSWTALGIGRSSSPPDPRPTRSLVSARGLRENFEEKQNRSLRGLKVCIPQQTVQFGLPRRLHYTTKEVATVLGISPDLIRWRIKVGNTPTLGAARERPTFNNRGCGHA